MVWIGINMDARISRNKVSRPGKRSLVAAKATGRQTIQAPTTPPIAVTAELNAARTTSIRSQASEKLSKLGGNASEKWPAVNCASVLSAVLKTKNSG